MNFDFSEFHPLDHHVLDPVCSGWYGGEKRHLELWWEYQLGPERVYEAYRRVIHCRRGNHRQTPYWTSLDDIDAGSPAGYLCRDCEWSST